MGCSQEVKAKHKRRRKFMLELYEGPPKLTHRKVGRLMNLAHQTVGQALRKACIERDWDRRQEARRNES